MVSKVFVVASSLFVLAESEKIAIPSLVPVSASHELELHNDLRTNQRDHSGRMTAKRDACTYQGALRRHSEIRSQLVKSKRASLRAISKLSLHL